MIFFASLALLLASIVQIPLIPNPDNASSAAPPPPLCTEMNNGAYFPSGYSLFDSVIGRSTGTIEYIAFQPSVSGTISTLKWYNSAGSHALWNACSSNYGSINPCDTTCGLPQNRFTAPSAYVKACPNGWNPFATTCSSNYSGCYSGGTGGVASFTLKDTTGATLATAVVNQPNVTYGFFSNFPVLNLSSSVSLTANSTYYLELSDTDSNPSANWWSADNYTPYNLFTGSQANAIDLTLVTLGGKPSVANVTMEDSFKGSPNTNFQPIIAFGFSNGTCITQGFAP